MKTYFYKNKIMPKITCKFNLKISRLFQNEEIILTEVFLEQETEISRHFLKHFRKVRKPPDSKMYFKTKVLKIILILTKIDK